MFEGFEGFEPRSGLVAVETLQEGVQHGRDLDNPPPSQVWATPILSPPPLVEWKEDMRDPIRELPKPRRQLNTPPNLDDGNGAPEPSVRDAPEPSSPLGFVLCACRL